MSEQRTYFSYPIVKETQYLIFILEEKREKTNVYGVLSATQTFMESGVTPNHVELGTIKWYRPYRKYAFFPESETIFDNRCMSDIITFIDGLMQERRQLRKK